jgi:uncharacterized membrane protein
LARVEESVEIKRPVDRVFAYVTNVKNLPLWESALLEVEQTSEGQPGTGATFKGAHSIMGRKMEWTSRCTECQPNKKWCEIISAGSVSIDIHLTFDSTSEGTKFTQAYDIELDGFLQLFAAMITTSMREQARADLAKLKGILEAQA